MRAITADDGEKQRVGIGDEQRKSWMPAFAGMTAEGGQAES